MKYPIAAVLLLFLISCGKNKIEQQPSAKENSAIPPYDTVAVDSFSQGATSIDIARKIKMSSAKYQDSLQKIKIKIEEEQLLKTAKEEQLAADKKAAEAQKKIQTDADKAKEKAPSANSGKDVLMNP